MSVPKLRFPEFLGAGEWEEKKLGDLYSFKSTNSFSRDQLNYENGVVRNIHYGDIHTKFSILFNIKNENVPFVNPSESLEKIKPDCYCVESDIIFADASEDLEDIGKSIEIVHLNNQKLLSGLHTLLARQKNNTFIVGFGGYLFKSNWIRNQIQKESQGTKVLGISATRLSSISIAFPVKKKEQQKIADCLTSLDDRITAEIQKLDTLKAHKKGLMQQLFPAEGETLPKLRFPEFRDAGEWEEKLLGAIVEVASGQVDPTEPPYCDLPHIGGENIESHTGNLHAVKTAKELRLISGKYLFNEGDILYSKIRPALNKVAIPDFKGICSADIYPLRPSDDKLCRRYLAYLLLSEMFLEYATKHSERSKIPKINRDSLLAYKVVIPYRPEQQRIADCLTSLDDLIAAQTQKIDTLKTHKKGLMQQLFPALDEVKA
jgi:type I restriction enzyme, S subunit